MFGFLFHYGIHDDTSGFKTIYVESVIRLYLNEQFNITFMTTLNKDNYHMV